MFKSFILLYIMGTSNALLHSGDVPDGPDGRPPGCCILQSATARRKATPPLRRVDKLWLKLQSARLSAVCYPWVVVVVVLGGGEHADTLREK